MAESIVILAPISQLGWRRACVAVTVCSSSRLSLRKGPPLAVSRIFSILLRPSPTRAWKMAECSLSTGRIGAWFSNARRVMISPATTRVSLLANAMVLWAWMAWTVGRSPAKPTIAVRTISMFSFSTTSQRACSPLYTLMSVSANASLTWLYLSVSAMTTVSGENSRACCMSRSALLPAVSVWASKRSLCCRMTSKACVPMLPVEPRMAIFFI